MNGDVEELKSLFAPHGSVYSNEQIMVPAPGQYDGHAAKLKFLPSFPSFSIPKQSRTRKKVRLGPVVVAVCVGCDRCLCLLALCSLRQAPTCHRPNATAHTLYVLPAMRCLCLHTCR